MFIALSTTSPREAAIRNNQLEGLIDNFERVTPEIKLNTNFTVGKKNKMFEISITPKGIKVLGENDLPF